MHPVVNVTRHMGRAGDPTPVVLKVELQLDVPEINHNFSHAVRHGVGLDSLPDNTLPEEIERITKPYQAAVQLLDIEATPDRLRVVVGGKYIAGDFQLNNNYRQATEVKIARCVAETAQKLAEGARPNDLGLPEVK